MLNLMRHIEIEVWSVKSFHSGDNERLPALCAPYLDFAGRDPKNFDSALTLQQPARCSKQGVCVRRGSLHLIACNRLTQIHRRTVASIAFLIWLSAVRL